MQWLGILVLGRLGPPTLAAMRWWTTRGERASDRRSEEASLLEQCMHAWGRQVLHVFDRGFAGVPWLTTLTAWQSRWLLRWPTRYHLVDDQGRERPAWQITRGKRSRATRLIRYGTQLQAIGLYWCAVQHPKLAVPLWLVVSRRGHGHQPWYLLTTEPVASADDAWQMVLAYARRWQIEMAWRSSKTELAYESPRCWQWETRRKLLMLASLAYAFLL
jgi:hypothetical protein